MNRMLGGQQLDVGTLLRDRRTENPFPSEAVLIAHCILDPRRVDQIETIDLTPPAATLLDVIHEFKGAVRTLGLAFVVAGIYDPTLWGAAEVAADAVRRKPILEHIDVYDLAQLVDSVRVVELTAVGTFEIVVSMMGGRLKPRKKKGESPKPAHERAISEAIGA